LNERLGAHSRLRMGISWLLYATHFSMPYRRIEGFTRALSRLVPRLPTTDCSWARRLRLDLSPYESLSGYDGPVDIAVDL